MTASQPIRVLHVAETAQGGVGSYIEEIVALHAERYGADSLRVVMPREHAIYFKRLPESVLRVFDRTNSGRLRNMLRIAALTLSQVRSWNPDVVHIHSTFAGFILRPLLMLLPSRPRIVYCAHGWAFDRETSARVNRLVMASERVLSRWCDAVVCISRNDLESGLRAGISAERMLTIMNGIADQGPRAAVDPSVVSRWPANTLRVLFVGRLDRQKGVDVLYEALRRLGDRVSVVVVGSAVVADDEAAPLPANVHMTGWLPRDQVPALYDACQVLVMPSRWEGFGLVAIEAMRAGRAVVATRVGGLPEVVDHGVTGWLFDSGDANALAEILGRLSAPDLEAMGAAGRLRFERLFTIRRVGDELDTLYRRLLTQDLFPA